LSVTDLVESVLVPSNETSDLVVVVVVVALPVLVDVPVVVVVVPVLVVFSHLFPSAETL